MGILGLGTPTVPYIEEMVVLAPLVAEAKEEVPIEWTPEYAESFARETARKYGIDEERFIDTLKCESMHFRDPKIQSGHYKNGVRETSYGYSQFHLPTDLMTADGRIITYEIAVNPAEAIDAAAYQFSIGNAKRWSCYKALK